MILQPDLVKAIKDGRKTVLRRLIKSGEYSCRYRVGRDYAIQPSRKEPQACRIRVTATGRELLRDITEGQARMEGFDGRAEFAAHWLRYHDRHLGPHVHKLDPDNIIEHFEERHGHKPTWVVTFELVIYDRHRPREGHPTLLAARSELGYTADRFRAMPDEPEAVPPDEVEALPATMEARQRWTRDRAEQQQTRERLPLGERIERALADARVSGTNTAHYERIIVAKVRALEARNRRKAA